MNSTRLQLNVPPWLVHGQTEATRWWRSRTRRERRVVTWLLRLLAATLVWAWLIQPAWNVLQSAPAQLDQLDMELQEMQRLAAESVALRAIPPISQIQASAALKAASDRLGDKARLNVQGERATLALMGVSPEALRSWINEVRVGARARPLEATLQRASSGFTGSVVISIGGGT